MYKETTQTDHGLRRFYISRASGVYKIKEMKGTMTLQDERASSSSKLHGRFLWMVEKLFLKVFLECSIVGTHKEDFLQLR